MEAKKPRKYRSRVDSEMSYWSEMFSEEEDDKKEAAKQKKEKEETEGVNSLGKRSHLANSLSPS